MADKFLEDLERKEGPLPVWVWGVLGGGVVGLVFYLRSKSSGSTSGTSSTDLTDGSSTPASTDTDPTTGLSYGTEEEDAEDYLNGISNPGSSGSEDGSGGSSPSATTTVPATQAQTISGELSDITGLVSQLQAAGFVASPSEVAAAVATPAGTTAGSSTTATVTDGTGTSAVQGAASNPVTNLASGIVAVRAAVGGAYKTVTIKNSQGQPVTAHEYQNAVPGGVGPGNKYIVIPTTSPSGHTASSAHTAVKPAAKKTPAKKT